MNAKETLMQFVGVIDKKLEDYWNEELSLNFGFNKKQKKLVEKMLHHSKEHNLRPAKRIRAAFVHYGYMLGNPSTHHGGQAGFGQVDERIWKAAMAVELVHTALLMHDDVMDQDDVRRGKPTTHRFFEDGDMHYGESMAYTTGDAILTLGYQLLLDSGFDNNLTIEAERKLLRGITNTAWGQAYDCTLEKLKDEWGEDDVMALHKAKTAIYTYENPLYIGAILAGLKGEVFDILTEYSMDGGVSFQLQDDILGIYGDPERTGKSANSDLLQGKGTLIIQKAFEVGNAEEKAALEKVWGKRFANQTDIEAAKAAIKSSGSYDYSNKVSRELAAKAAKTADRLRGLGLNTEAVDFIQGIAQYMVERDL